MNLYYLGQKRDPNVVISEHARPVVRRIGGDVWRGFDMRPATEPQLRIRRATAWRPFRERPETVGWLASAQPSLSFLSLSFTKPDATTEAMPPSEVQLGPALAPVRLPWSIHPVAADLDLTLHVPASAKAPVFLAVHRALERKDLIDLCQGRGLEIGPGPKPQVLPNADVEVSYIEQMPPDEWRRLYGNDSNIEVDEGLWDRYKVGDAHDLPVQDGSLDFIFSSHVFEHLANPLKHLEIWGQKLKKGGRVVAVVPDYIGSKDYASDPSELSELVAEYEAGDLAPNRQHYARFARARGIADGGERMWRERRSIHVHFYSHANMARLLEEAVRRFGFEGFSITHTPNHKDFHFVIVR